VASIGPVNSGTGKALKEVLRSHRPDYAWADELRKLRERMEPVADPNALGESEMAAETVKVLRLQPK
jgi:hypothetical protein